MKLSELSLSNMSGGAFPAGSHHISHSQLGQSAGSTMQQHQHQQQQQPKILNESNVVVYTNALSASQLFQEKLRNESQAYYQVPHFKPEGMYVYIEIISFFGILMFAKPRNSYYFIITVVALNFMSRHKKRFSSFLLTNS